jgi:hypothetical protein
LESGLAPLGETEAEKQEQTFSGHVQTYHEYFRVWATQHLSLEDQAPPDVRRQLAIK